MLEITESAPLACDEARVSRAHAAESLGGVAIERRGELGLDQREKIANEHRASGHPLVVRAPAVVIGPVQPALGKALHQPVEEGLVTHVHAKRHLRLLAVAPKRSLADQQPNYHTPLEVAQLLQLRSSICFTVQKNVKRWGLKRAVEASHSGR
jgi:hypothetical protein